MKVLLDTHAWIWWLFEPSRLPDRARAILADEAVLCSFSAASAWEIAIKLQLGKLSLPAGLDEVLGQLDAQSIRWLDVSRAHCLRVQTLPLHHRDPFDRMLAAQAIEESLRILSGDPGFDNYGLQRIWRD